MDDLKEKFEELPEEEKVEFIKSIMPTMCDIFRKNPQKMMNEMMPLCQDMMRNMDVSNMMNMMGNQQKKNE